MIKPLHRFGTGTAFLALALCAACGTGRVRAGQATEIRQEEVYEPSTKVDPPEGNSERLPEAYPLLEVDLERRRPAYEPDNSTNPE
ncbi:MAG: hypothetical protein AAF500_09380 [Myxococcota bacterium]